MKILLTHGEGFLPYQIDRLTKGYEQWADISISLQAEPKAYLKRFWFDTLLWNKNTLDFLIRAVGDDRVVTGSDFPFDLCSFPPGDVSQLDAETLLER